LVLRIWFAIAVQQSVDQGILQEILARRPAVVESGFAGSLRIGACNSDHVLDTQPVQGGWEADGTQASYFAAGLGVERKAEVYELRGSI
jgi:hypothetical protein